VHAWDGRGGEIKASGAATRQAKVEDPRNPHYNRASDLVAGEFILVYTHSAVSDLIRLRQFIAAKNPDAARRYSARLQKAIGRLADHPKLGKELEEPVGVRDLVAGDYVARYSVTPDCIDLLRIWHSREDRP
jgi:plasmid stabilization system protein ParE